MVVQKTPQDDRRGILSYKIDLGAWNGIFAVPCEIVDRQLRMAGEPQLKALLYILRHSGRSVELSELAAACANIAVRDRLPELKHGH